MDSPDIKEETKENQTSKNSSDESEISDDDYLESS